MTKEKITKNINNSAAIARFKPIKIYDHLPGILAGYPALMFFLFSLLSLPNEYPESWVGQNWPTAINPHLLFWVGLSLMVVWYIAFRFNLPKSKFWLAFGLFGTFVGIPVVLELTGFFRPFYFMGEQLGRLAPEINSSAYFILAIVFGALWLGNFIWSRTHLRVRIDESGLTINRLGGKGERFDLIGMKTENEPLDYLELFIAGIGSLSLKTRMGKPIFTMKRVFGLYRIPLFPFFKGKLARIEEMLTYQGKVLAVDPKERAEMAEALDAEGDAEVDLAGMDDDGNGDESEIDAVSKDEPSSMDEDKEIS